MKPVEYRQEPLSLGSLNTLFLKKNTPSKN